MSESQVGQVRRGESGSKSVMRLKSWDREYSQQAAESDMLRQNEDESMKEPSTTTTTPFSNAVLQKSELNMDLATRRDPGSKSIVKASGSMQRVVPQTKDGREIRESTMQLTSTYEPKARADQHKGGLRRFFAIWRDSSRVPIMGGMWITRKPGSGLSKGRQSEAQSSGVLGLG